MCRLIETICLKDRQLLHPEWHEKRLNDTRKELFGITASLKLQDFITLPSSLQDGVYKCRILYGEQIESVEFQPYSPRLLRSLQLVECGELDYRFKYEDRGAIDRLSVLRGNADDILLVRDGLITDTSFSNIVFFDGKSWVTPDSCLLNGTQRQRLLFEGVIEEVSITVSDLKKYSYAKPINAMLDFAGTETFPVTAIRRLH